MKEAVSSALAGHREGRTLSFVYIEFTPKLYGGGVRCWGGLGGEGTV